ncbi:MAG: DUF1576 domain-containing protein [Spirochaetes bacterium]|nr:DUF1576 domain-containing protein [Spirochaetota bacterium]MBU1081766.1 DUF1576 domain-containing protein [Spirochaetota bacterium]
MTYIPYEPPPNDFEMESRHARAALFGFLGFLLAFGLAASRFDLLTIARGLGAVIVSPDILINDYASIAGMGPAFVNSALCVFVAICIIRLSRVAVSGPVIAAVFTIAGFSLFGKNIVNIWPGIFGAWLYSIASRRPFGENIIVALFGTALAPLSSEVAFGLGIQAPWNVAVAVAVGAVAGFLISPIARHALDFHRGYNLYNIGFAAGLIGTVAMSGLSAFGVPLAGGFHWAVLGPLPVLPYLAAFFAALIIAGMILDPRWPAAYRRILSSPGRLVSDFVRYYGLGATFVNMGVMGLLASGVVLAIGGSWNGPVIGGVLTIVGFSAFGKHPRNVLPPMLGAAAMAVVSNYGIDKPASQLAVLFASTLAPVSGEYGPVAGFAAGMTHLVLVQVVGTLHGGLNLYNNGFAGGLTAGLFLPVLEWLREWRRHEV